MFWGTMHIRLLWVHPDRRQFYATLGNRQIGLPQGYERNASRHYFEKDLTDE